MCVFKLNLLEMETPVNPVAVVAAAVVIVAVRSPAADALFLTRSTNTSWSRGATRDTPGNAWPRPFSKRCWRWRWDDHAVLPPTFSLSRSPARIMNDGNLSRAPPSPPAQRVHQMEIKRRLEEFTRRERVQRIKVQH